MKYSVGEGYRSPRAGHVIVIQFAQRAVRSWELG